jgi:hypothetical protein
MYGKVREKIPQSKGIKVKLLCPHLPLQGNLPSPPAYQHLQYECDYAFCGGLQKILQGIYLQIGLYQ